MKKVLGLALSLVAVIALSACGGGGASTGKSAGAASAVMPVLAKSIGNVGSNSIKVDTQSTGSFQYVYSCPTSGNATTNATYTVDSSGSTGSISITTNSAFTACAGTDTRCTPALAYVLDGTIDGTTNVVVGNSTASWEASETGDIKITGFASFDCPIDIKIDITDFTTLENATDKTIFDLMTGTICGVSVSDIEKLINDTDANYCAGVKEIAASNS